MTQKMTKALVLCAVLALTLLIFTFHVTSGQNGDKINGTGRLEGPWNVRVSVTNCDSGAVIRSFDSITQFMEGGTLIDSTSGVPQALKTPGQGVWEHTVGLNYRFKFKSFTFDPSGTYTGYTVIQHNATLSPLGDSYESAGTLEVYAPNGNLVATGCSSTTATRFGF